MFGENVRGFISCADRVVAGPKKPRDFVRNVAEFGAEVSQKRTAFLKPKRGWLPRLPPPYQPAYPGFEPEESRKESTGPGSRHERDEKLVLDF